VLQREERSAEPVSRRFRLMRDALRNATFLGCLFVLIECPATTKADPTSEQDARAAKGAPRQVAFDDDFDDGNTDGWVFLPNSKYGTEPNWVVENQTLAQLSLWDHNPGLVEGLVVGNQTAETDVWLSGPGDYGGLTLWYHDDDNRVEVGIYPAAGGLRVWEWVAGQHIDKNYSLSFRENTWHRLRIEANSRSGRIDIYVNDVYLTSYKAASLRRAGLSGLFGGNSGGHYDNYSLRGRIP
jgi:hypothetical protein